MIRKTGTFDSIFKLCDDQPGDVLRQFPSFSFKDYKSFGFEGQSQDLINWNFVACPSEQKAQNILPPATFGLVAPFESNKARAQPRDEPVRQNKPAVRLAGQLTDPSIRPKSMRISKKNRELISCEELRTRSLCYFKGICSFRRHLTIHSQRFLEPFAWAIQQVRWSQHQKAIIWCSEHIHCDEIYQEGPFEIRR